MQVFLVLFLKIIPLYTLIALGYIAGKYLKVSKESIASLLLYIVVPVVFFSNILKMEISYNVLLIPILFFLISSSLCLFIYTVTKRHWKDASRNILALSAGNGNTGYFGIPVAIVLFGEKAVGLMVLCILGVTIYENTLGFYITAKGKHTAGESIRKLLKIPTIYAAAIALIFNFSGVKFGPDFFNFTANFTGMYSILGMMMVGLGLASVKKQEVDYKFIGFAFFTRFILWPIIIFSFIWLDTNMLHLFTPFIHQIFILLSVVPMAVNSIAFATELDAKPEKVSTAVFLSTIFALFYIPLVTGIFLKH